MTSFELGIHPNFLPGSTHASSLEATSIPFTCS